MVVAKPPRLLVHRTGLARDRLAVLQWVRDQLGQRVYTVHRIDRPTSGCVLIGTEASIGKDLHAALRAEETHKTYLALVRGHIEPGSQTTLDGEIDGKAARTDVTVLGSVTEPRSSLVHCRIHSGRFHQIRRHLARIGHPVIGDSQHGDTRINRYWREERGMTRLALHAWTLRATLPDGGTVDARCPVWPDLRQVLEGLPELWDEAVRRAPELAEPWETLPPWPGRPEDGPILDGMTPKPPAPEDAEDEVSALPRDIDEPTG